MTTAKEKYGKKKRYLIIVFALYTPSRPHLPVIRCYSFLEFFSVFTLFSFIEQTPNTITTTTTTKNTKLYIAFDFIREK